MGRYEKILSGCGLWWWNILIFITLGSQKFQFNRLLEEVDILINNDVIKGENVFAQIGYSDYIPKQYNYEKFLNKEDFLKYIKRSEIVITHGGTGSIINAVKMGKKVIGVPRLVDFGEHVDNHQLEIIDQFTDSNLIYGLLNIQELGNAVANVKNIEFRKYQSNTQNVLNILEDYLSKVEKDVFRKKVSK